MTTLEALVGLNLAGEVGTIRLKRLLDFFGKPENIFKASAQKLQQTSGIGENIASRITTLKQEDVDKELALAEKLGLKIIILGDADYPENLKHIPDPAIVLYVKGELKPEDKYGIGIVGSRRASFYGLSNAEKFASDLSIKGLTIISGMARGIDTYAHRGALKQGGRTIAVMGSGFGNIYPPENKKLLNEIAQNGAVISEFPINTRPLKENFPRRNRIISGLSLGVLVVEAAKNSGALITADFALEQGREVFALPGKVDSGTSFGTNGLIKQGAKLVSSVEDILEELNLTYSVGNNIDPVKSTFGGPRGLRRVVNQTSVSYATLLDNDEKAVYDLISQSPLVIDEITERANMGIPKIYDLLFRLELRKLVKQLPGKQYVKAENEK